MILNVVLIHQSTVNKNNHLYDPIYNCNLLYNTHMSQAAILLLSFRLVHYYILRSYGADGGTEGQGRGSTD